MSEYKIDWRYINDPDAPDIDLSIDNLTSQLADIATRIKSSGSDDSTNIQTAINNFPSTGGTLLFPDANYIINSNITFNGKLINIISKPKTTFSGTGSFPTNITNANHQIKRNYMITNPSGGVVQKGDVTFTAEVSPDSTFVGNAVAGYFGAKSGTGNGGVWAVNPICSVDSGFTGNVNTVEIDTDSYSSTAQKVQGLLVTGVGTNNIYAGIAIDRADNTRNQTGLLISKVINGINILNADDSGIVIANTGMQGIDIGNATTNGIFIHDMEQGHIKIKPTTDNNPSNSVIMGVNAADTSANFYITKGGQGSFSALQVNSGTIVKGILSAAPTLTIGSVPANSILEVTTTLTGAKVTDSITANPIASPGNGLIWSAYVSSANTVTIRIANVTTGAITPASVQWIINDLQMF